ncbi:MAG: TetR/AcrR family transcriptional regulator [Hyphomicrobiales bacterium]|nr:TetR/AcrR family transcriptional regulator [Hyphomicrobiales bacterium]
MTNSDAADTRTRILDEAERLFRVYGYAKTTVADIASACAMSPSNVYRFFATKADINSAICERILLEKVRRMAVIAGRDASASDRMAALTHDLYSYTLETLLDEKKVHEMVVVALEEHWSVIEEHLYRMTEIIERVIADGVKSGEFRPQDTVTAARNVMTTLIAFNHPTIMAQCLRYQQRTMPEEIIPFILAALKA